MLSKRVLINHSAAVLSSFLCDIKCPVPLSVLHQTILELTNFPKLSLQDMHLVVSRLRGNSILFQCEGLPPHDYFPLIGMVSSPDNSQSHLEDQYSFVVLYWLEGTLNAFDPLKGHRAFNDCDLEDTLTGLFVGVDPDASDVIKTYPEEWTAIAAEEAAEAVKYARSLQLVDLADEREVNELISASADLALAQAGVLDDGNSESQVVQESRKGYASFLYSKNATLNGILSRLPEVTHGGYQQREPAQFIQYGEGDYFRPHFDASTCLRRTTTVLLYLSDDFSGGETAFPLANTSITPRKGRALVFQNIDNNGNVIPHSFHESLPVFNGRKLAMNIWLQNGL